MDKNLKFLQFCLSASTSLPSSFLKDMDWHDLFLFACKQSLVGICWCGIERLYDKNGNDENDLGLPNKPSASDVVEWLSVVRLIRRRNEQLFEKVAFVSRKFDEEGFDSCLLKGQGNALMYPDSMLRTPGDIDIWVSPKGSQYCADREIIAYCRRFVPDTKYTYHHIEFVSADNIPVEVHYRPSWLFNPLANRRLQNFFASSAACCFANSSGKGFNVPTWEFNVVFQLSHIYNHLLHEGIGFRQLVDYYYLLKSRPAESDTRKVVYNINMCNMKRIAMSVTWLLQTVFNLEEEFLLFPADVRGGRFLLNEILEGGNFGKFDNRVMSGTYSNAVMRNLQRLFRDIRMLWLYPGEGLSEPFFRLWHFFWRIRHSRS